MSDDIYKAPESNVLVEPKIPTVMRVEAQPLSFRNLIKLYLRPKEYFSSELAIQAKISTLLVIYAFGIYNVMDRLDQNLLKGGASLKAIDPIVSHWLYYWLFVLFFGVISAAMTWYVGGWWYKVRLSWAGVTEPDPLQARTLYVYSSFVMVFPALIACLAETFIYDSYLEAWESKATLSSVFLIGLYFWSCWVSYSGVSAKFDAYGMAAKMWFFILPISVYIVAIGAMMVALNYLPN